MDGAHLVDAAIQHKHGILVVDDIARGDIRKPDSFKKIHQRFERPLLALFTSAIASKELAVFA